MRAIIYRNSCRLHAIGETKGYKGKTIENCILAQPGVILFLYHLLRTTQRPFTTELAYPALLSSHVWHFFYCWVSLSFFSYKSFQLIGSAKADNSFYTSMSCKRKQCFTAVVRFFFLPRVLFLQREMASKKQLGTCGWQLHHALHAQIVVSIEGISGYGAYGSPRGTD